MGHSLSDAQAKATLKRPNNCQQLSMTPIEPDAARCDHDGKSCL